MNREKLYLFFESISKLRLKRSVTAVFFLILSIITVNLKFISTLFALIAILIGIINYNKSKKSSLVIIFTAFIIIIITLLIIPFINRDKIDPYRDINVLLGNWNYNTNGGYYNFNDDKTYFQYLSDNKEDDYCKGTYRYTFGYQDKNDISIKQDVDFAYYTLILNPETCLFGGMETTTKEILDEKRIIFGYGKLNNSTSVMMNEGTFDFIKVKKIS